MISKDNLYGGFQVDCDRCDAVLAIDCAHISSNTVKNAIDTARMYGWSIGKKMNLCPDCKKTTEDYKLQCNKDF